MNIRQISLGEGCRAGWVSEDRPEELQAHLGARSAHLPRQVHGTEVAWVDDAGETEADGLWTQSPGLMIGVRTADCLPILVANESQRIVAAVHAGWRGLAGGILERLARAIVDGGARLDECVLFLGPAIGPCCYQVEREVGQRFGSHFNGKTLDLRGFALYELALFGFSMDRILNDTTCTCCAPDLPSHRRLPDNGRILTAISLKNDHK
jgi:hypothetical protein